MSELRIFSYLFNPRVWKATIAGRLCGIEVDMEPYLKKIEAVEHAEAEQSLAQ